VKEKVAHYRALIESETDIIAVMANTSAFIMENLSGLNWVGFYRASGDDELILGPFQGRPACYRISYGKGVCGHCAVNRNSIIVPDVHAFSGHIACDAASKSELVVPIMHNGVLFGVIDLDAPEYNRFTDTDRLFIEAIAEIFSQKL
jgi:hypothetical protein